MQNNPGLTVAMWSGPRNISTAMMRAWENRTDCDVWDEPFYAHFLQHTDIDHPMANEVIAAYDTDAASVIAKLRERPATGLAYQKHISTHMLDHIPLDWLSDVCNIFLIREPEYMVASYSVKRAEVTADDLGYTQLEKVFDEVQQVQGKTPLVIHSRRFLQNPEVHLRHVCDYLDVEFQENMLAWPAGVRESDGLWEAHWYDSVRRSTGFGPPRSGEPNLDTHQLELAEQCRPHFETLNQHALVV